MYSQLVFSREGTNTGARHGKLQRQQDWAKGRNAGLHGAYKWRFCQQDKDQPARPGTGARSVVLLAAAAESLAPLPMPVASCFLDARGPGLSCIMGRLSVPRSVDHIVHSIPVPSTSVAILPQLLGGCRLPSPDISASRSLHSCRFLFSSLPHPLPSRFTHPLLCLGSCRSFRYSRLLTLTVDTHKVSLCPCPLRSLPLTDTHQVVP